VIVNVACDEGYPGRASTAVTESVSVRCERSRRYAPTFSGTMTVVRAPGATVAWIVPAIAGRPRPRADAPVGLAVTLSRHRDMPPEPGHLMLRLVSTMGLALRMANDGLRATANGASASVGAATGGQRGLGGRRVERGWCVTCV
jgi:hypothetical protein